MDIERERLIEIVAAVGAVGALIAAMVAIGAIYGNGEQMSEPGGTLLVGSIVFFVLLMAGVGYWLALTVTPEENAGDDATNDSANSV